MGFNDLGYFHSTDLVYSYFGCTYLADGSSGGNVSHLTGQPGTIASDFGFDYPIGTNADEYVSEIGANGGNLHFKCQSNIGRAVYYDGGNYKTIHQTFIFGAMVDGHGGTKEMLIQKYIDWFLESGPTPTPTEPGSNTHTPTPTNTPVPPTETPVPPTNTPVPTETPVPPTNTPVPTETPIPPTATPECDGLGVTLWMPSDDFGPGDPCSCKVEICNPGPETYNNVPLFIVLDIAGSYFFAPSYSDFDKYILAEVPPGASDFEILQEFDWPTEAGSFNNAVWFAAMTNSTMTELLGYMDTWQFSWHS